jgi:hypothetical protein
MTDAELLEEAIVSLRERLAKPAGDSEFFAVRDFDSPGEKPTLAIFAFGESARVINRVLKLQAPNYWAGTDKVRDRQ